jgi:hypothetical protein
MGNDAECFALDQPLKPKTVFPVSGVTFEGRQGALALLAAAFAEGQKFSNYNGGLELRPEPENKFDKHAVAIWAKVGGEFQPIGYVPKYSCPACGQFIQVNRRGGDKHGPEACHGCGISFVNMTQQNLNRWICDNFVAKSRPMACGLVWAGQGRRGSSFGARVGLWWEKDGKDVVPQ